MSFYYQSIFSYMFLAILYLIAIGLWWLFWVKMVGRKFSGLVTWTVVVVVLVAPWTEEFMISYRFARLCEGAGVFIYQKVLVDGFYDDTNETHAGPPTPQAAAAFDRSGYTFLEMRFKDKVVHLEKQGGQWHPQVLDQPMARYHYRNPDRHTQVAHKITKIESVVVDSETSMVLARETIYTRGAPWFYIGLDRPLILCRGMYPLRGALYEQVLLPK
ncbi:MAG: hypothetical protein ABI612_15465 [Betaproteobacteria bacterium]